MVAFGNKSPLETAIAKNQIEIWNIMRNGLELSEKEKLVQLRAMIECGRMEEDVYFKEFKELLSSLPVELVNDFISNDSSYIAKETLKYAFNLNQTFCAAKSLSFH